MQRTNLHLPSIEEVNHPFFNYTSGRWLYNEALRLTERRMVFNVKALTAEISRAANKSTGDLRSFEKIAEGGSYRVFEAKFGDDDLGIIVRIPYPCTQPHGLGVASEVATLDFLRSRGYPVPVVLGWSATSSNEAGTGYIIMSKVAGKELESIWYTMSLEQRMRLVERLVALEKRLFELDLPAYGSIYHKSFLDGRPDLSYIPFEGPFCIGPSAEFLWWYNARDRLQVERGPWTSPQEVMRSVGERERAWLMQFGRPRFPRQPLYREFYAKRQVSPQEQVSSLDLYLKIAPSIVPADGNLRRPTIRHPDLSPSNVFISDSGDITGLIDWQHTAVLPLFLQAKVPQHFQNYGDEDSENFSRPELPQGFESLPAERQEQELEIFRRRQLHYFYIGYTSQKNDLHFEALSKRDLVVRHKLYEAAARPWEGDNTSLKAELIKASKLSPISTEVNLNHDTALRLPFAEDEAAKCLEIDRMQIEAAQQLQSIRDFIPINVEEDGSLWNCTKAQS